MKRNIIIKTAILLVLFCDADSHPVIRPSALAGKWYASGSAGLASEIDTLLKKSKPEKTEAAKPSLLILPHAGYPYSGMVAAAGYNTVRNITPDLIVIIGTSHHSYYHGCSIQPVDYYETPLGRIKVEKDMALSLLREPLFHTEKNIHDMEHSIEIQIPFLQRMFRDATRDKICLLPILAGDFTEEEATLIADSIAKTVAAKKNPLFIISSDFTHYGPNFDYTPFTGSGKVLNKKINELDSGAINLILRKDVKGFYDYIRRTGATICGRNSIAIALSLPFTGFKSHLIAYDTSGNITGDFSNSVSYAAISFSGTIARENTDSKRSKSMKYNLSDDEKKFLLNIARKNITSLLSTGKSAEIDPAAVSENCRANTGVFVTLKKKGDLRGCIGYVQGIKPLYEAVIDNSYNAAFQDPRFPALKKSEFDNVSIEISVLTVPEPVKSVDEIEVGRDGLIMEKGFSRGLLLPQVPVEWGWTRDEFLSHTCTKAGLPPDEWKHGAKIYKFQAIVFGEGE